MQLIWIPMKMSNCQIMNKIILQAALSSEYKLCKLQNVVLKPEIVHTTQAGNQFSSVQFSRSVVSNSLQPHELQHARPPCPSPAPRVHSNSCPSSRWCHSVISSFVVPFSSCPQSLPASESFPISQLFTWGGQSIGVSALASFPGLISFRMDWLDLLAVQGTLKSLLQHHSSKASVLQCSAFFTVQLSVIHTWPLEKP